MLRRLANSLSDDLRQYEFQFQLTSFDNVKQDFKLNNLICYNVIITRCDVEWDYHVIKSHYDYKYKASRTESYNYIFAISHLNIQN